MNVVPIKPARKLPEDFGDVLRKLATRCDAGEIHGFVGLAMSDQYEFLWPSSLHDSLVLSSLLQHRAAAKFGVNEP